MAERTLEKWQQLADQQAGELIAADGLIDALKKERDDLQEQVAALSAAREVAPEATYQGRPLSQLRASQLMELGRATDKARKAGQPTPPAPARHPDVSKLSAAELMTLGRSKR